jgi:hypothetical membrane protein
LGQEKQKIVYTDYMEKTAGSLFFLGGALLWMGITTAEIFYPAGYSISGSMISNLGATPPPNSLVFEPSANIFDYSVLLSGVLILVGALLLYRTNRYNPFALNLGLIGLGTAGVGMFPAFHLAIHSLSALIAFGSGGVGAIYSGYLFKPPFRYLAIILGTISLVCLGLGLGDSSLVLPLLGKGGTERWVAYPTMIWLIGLGGFLMAGKSQKS